MLIFHIFAKHGLLSCQNTQHAITNLLEGVRLVQTASNVVLQDFWEETENKKIKELKVVTETNFYCAIIWKVQIQLFELLIVKYQVNYCKWLLVDGQGWKKKTNIDMQSDE